GQLRRFTTTHTVLAAEEPKQLDENGKEKEEDPIRAARRQTTANGGRLTLAAEDAAKYLTARLTPEGKFPDLVRADAGGGAGYDWTSHAAVTLFLAEAGAHFE